MTQTGIFNGRVLVPYAYGCYGYTRGGGKTWHGGIDLVGPDDATIRMPYYTARDGTQKAIRGKVITARIVTDHSNRTWEWGWYVCVQLDADQTPDAVNYLYFCHCERLLVQVGQTVISGQELAIMGNSGNAALNSPPYKHCHLEVRATATGRGLNPTAYSGTDNAAGTY
ncbi:M23 family metallopeptidase, partial [Subdoligranulum variabile]